MSKRVFGERARQEQERQKQQHQQLQQHEEVGDLVETVVVAAVKHAKELQRSRTPTIQVPLSSSSSSSSSMLDRVPRNNSGNRTPTTPKISIPPKDLAETSSSSRSSSYNGQLHLSSSSSPTTTTSKPPDDENDSSNDVQPRPLKIPRRERAIEDHKKEDTVNAHSTETVSSMTTEQQGTVLRQQHLPPPPLQATSSTSSITSSRRSSLPLHTQQQQQDYHHHHHHHHHHNTESADPNAASSSSSNNSDASAFYLKYQNRALSTELKLHQFTVRELEAERTIRRSHCLAILQSLHHFIHIWNSMEDTLTKSKHRQERIEYGGNESNFDFSNDIKGNNYDNIYASTGTDDSVEWTRALYNALIKLGRTTINREVESQPRKNGVVDHHQQQHGNLDETGDSNYELSEFQHDANLPQMEQVTANLTARANILQERIEKLLSELQDNRSSSLQDMENTDTESALASTSSLQNQISNLQARCLLLEGQVTELVSCRTELQQRERRLRRNIYRMSAELMTPQQVVASAMSVNKENDNNDDDDIETAVQIEKQELVKLRQEHEALLESIQNKSSATSSVNHDDVTSHSANILLSKQVKEYQNKILQLEESITIAEQSIQELNEKLKSREEEISLLSQRQLSEDDRNKLESITSLQQQLHNSQESFTELQTKFNKTEQMWSQSLGNEKAALHAISDLVQKFNKRWAELKTNAFTATITSTTAADVNNDPSLVGSSCSNSSKTELVDKTIASATDEPILSLDSEMNGDTHPQIIMSKKIVELQHQLQQALENVRQAESSRENLKTALSLNATLQGKYDEMKAKYTAIQQQAATSRGGNVVNSDNPVVTKKSSDPKNRQSSSKISIAIDQQMSESMTDLGALDGATTPLSTDIDLNPVISDNGKSVQRKGKDGTSKPENSKSQSATAEGGSDKTTANHNSSSNRTTSVSASSSEKYRKARKDLAAMTANHATLMASNARLLKQINEKDEMNAKSLSTILHLKGLTEKLVEERDQLEAQMKTASQLALAARLATNAKERVSEELLKEKEESEICRIAAEEKLETTQKELHRISMEWANASSVIATKERELSNLTQRSNKLIEENEEQRNLIRKLKNTVSQSEREAREANEKITDLVSKFDKEDVKIDNGLLGESSSRGVSSSSFTIEQLQTQVSVLKNRLACPVCHYRDKECIIIRCRHMHCKQCVDERISNRSRKCPTCNVKFAENEVETIFLS